MVEPAPDATRQTVSALQTRDLRIRRRLGSCWRRLTRHEERDARSARGCARSAGDSGTRLARARRRPGPGRSITSVLDHARLLLRGAPRRPPPIAASSRGPHPREDFDARLMHERGGDRAVEPCDPAGLNSLLAGAGEHDAIDRLPCLGPDGADRYV